MRFKVGKLKPIPMAAQTQQVVQVLDTWTKTRTVEWVDRTTSMFS